MLGLPAVTITSGLKKGEPRRIVTMYATSRRALPVPRFTPPDAAQPRSAARHRTALFCFRDLGVFFHPWCAPHIPLPEKIQHEVAEILAQAFIAHYEPAIVRWTRVAESIDPKKGPARFHALLTSAYGRRVFTMGRADWDRFRTHDGQLIEI
jgi:hypothetical protein